MSTDAARTTTVTTAVTIVPFPAEADMCKVAIFDVAAAVVAWICLDNTKTTFAAGDVNCERILPNTSILVPWRASYLMLTESGTTSVNVVVAKGRV